MPDSCDQALKASGSLYLTKQLQALPHLLRSGYTLANSLQNNLIPALFLQMVIIGEESGELPAMLNNVATYYLEQLQLKTDALTMMIEPIVMSLLGLIIGTLVIALYLPIFELMVVIG
ncbi:type II secretion system F family protein [Vibrio sp. SS-MA-C1-2]|nr:type II secretion system F family protein [Vibrio sp. SS-MA-C1-2]